MKKTLAILLTLIILITSVSYDSYAVNIPVQYNDNNYPYTLMFTVYRPNGIDLNTYYYISTKPLTFDYYQLDKLALFSPANTSYKMYVTINDSTWTYSTNVINAPSYHEVKVFETESLIFKQIDYSNYSVIGVTSETTYTPPPDYIPTPDEYLYITTPREGFKTIDKFMTYNVMYSIAAENINDVTLKIYDENNVPFTEAPLIESFDALNHTARLENGYLKGQVQIWADYKGTVVGPVGVNISVLNTATNRELKVARNVEIVPFTDADGDGFDDVTGEDQFYRPDIPGLDNLDLDLGTAVDTIRTVIPGINSGVTNIVALLAVMFSWLPDQVTSLLMLIMILIAVTTIIKILRG